jgi:hypothetical protein
MEHPGWHPVPTPQERNAGSDAEMAVPDAMVGV